MTTPSSASTCGAADPSCRRAGARALRRHAAALVLSVSLSPALLTPGLSAQAPAADAQTIFERAIADFRAGRVSDSAAGFDRIVQLAPDTAPRLWQRGIALYYAGRYDDCRAQFESHRTVNPNDVENAAWHFLCVARAESPARARDAMLPVGRDPRRPLPEIYRMFRGTMTPESVLVAAGRDPSARFYASLYVGLYMEALGEERARFYITEAAADAFAEVGGYMNTVAKVHMGVRGWKGTR